MLLKNSCLRVLFLRPFTGSGLLWSLNSRRKEGTYLSAVAMTFTRGMAWQAHWRSVEAPHPASDLDNQSTCAGLRSDIRKISNQSIENQDIEMSTCESLHTLDADCFFFFCVSHYFLSVLYLCQQNILARPPYRRTEVVHPSLAATSTAAALLTAFWTKEMQMDGLH